MTKQRSFRQPYDRPSRPHQNTQARNISEGEQTRRLWAAIFSTMILISAAAILFLSYETPSKNGQSIDAQLEPLQTAPRNISSEAIDAQPLTSVDSTENPNTFQVSNIKTPKSLSPETTPYQIIREKGVPNLKLSRRISTAGSKLEEPKLAETAKPEKFAIIHPQSSFAPSLKPGTATKRVNHTVTTSSTNSLQTHPLNLRPAKLYPMPQNPVSFFSTPNTAFTNTASFNLDTVDYDFDITHESQDNSRSNVPLPLTKYDTDIHSQLSHHKIRLKRGQSLADLFASINLKRTEANQAIHHMGQFLNLRTLQAGLEFNVTTTPPNQTYHQIIMNKTDNDHYLVSLDLKIDDENRLAINRKANGQFNARKIAIATTRKLQSVSGTIKGNLYQSMHNLDVPDDIIDGLANIFSFDVDFQRDIFKGDQFEAIYEVIYDEDGNIIGGGDILFGRLTWRGNRRDKGYYFYDPKTNTQRADYFDQDGRSARRLLMKTPIDGARLSSSFGPRRHPILGYRKTHKGVDFAARRGTPIKATGDGIIERANRFSTYGNYVRIRHNNSYKTAYAHLKGFGRGIRKGKRVRQGDIIGYVGTTGRSTGPHLHYEVHHKGKAVNPQKLKIATGIKLNGKPLNGFLDHRTLLDQLRPVVWEQTVTQAASKQENTQGSTKGNLGTLAPFAPPSED